MTERDQTCAERIGDQLASRIAHLSLLGDAYRYVQGDPDVTLDDVSHFPDHTGYELDDVYQAIDELPLHVSVTRTVVVLLSTGGPHDEFRVDVDDDGDWQRIVYRFADWHDVADRVLDDDEAAAVWPILEQYVAGAVTQ